ncbi:hypothetical protein CHH28_13090 [Bacterioplanes sanyensis]|uniref:Uncharacterized protein n=2 Tax=Bacterioplanes sanyensis TaxID=1249553 RepID=A0A222FMV1_9GAMM|nr:hypothetical protein CHH28_13090 [Bacterioplanes sanyensis]
MRAYRVRHLLVFAHKGADAKMLAAPELRPMAEWQQDVSAWVALRADREPQHDDQLDANKSEPYIDTRLSATASTN